LPPLLKIHLRLTLRNGKNRTLRPSNSLSFQRFNRLRGRSHFSSDQFNRFRPERLLIVSCSLTAPRRQSRSNRESRCWMSYEIGFSSPVPRKFAIGELVGACTVLVDGQATYACMKLAVEMQGRQITTIEGIGSPNNLTPVQRAFVECDALMCGYCTPGFVMSLTALFRSNPNPTLPQIKKACSGNLCRCGSYPHIFRAAERAKNVVLKISHAHLEASEGSPSRRFPRR
jgi:aerobic-type carbon monoxide dehydrogenase small subunit (CoxS/CutS family)